MNIEFISYTGKWPNLCSGILTLKIDGVEKKFGYSYEDDAPVDYDKFWYTGGCVRFDSAGCSCIEKGAWQLNENNLPEELEPYGDQLIDIFNKNVEYGCCGGCL